MNFPFSGTRLIFEYFLEKISLEVQERQLSTVDRRQLTNYPQPIELNRDPFFFSW
jgi:hypothetical protein